MRAFQLLILSIIFASMCNISPHAVRRDPVVLNYIESAQALVSDDPIAINALREIRDWCPGTLWHGQIIRDPSCSAKQTCIFALRPRTDGSKWVTSWLAMVSHNDRCMVLLDLDLSRLSQGLLLLHEAVHVLQTRRMERGESIAYYEREREAYAAQVRALDRALRGQLTGLLDHLLDANSSGDTAEVERVYNDIMNRFPVANNPADRDFRQIHIPVALALRAAERQSGGRNELGASVLEWLLHFEEHPPVEIGLVSRMTVPQRLFPNDTPEFQETPTTPMVQAATVARRRQPVPLNRRNSDPRVDVALANLGLATIASAERSVDGPASLRAQRDFVTGLQQVVTSQSSSAAERVLQVNLPGFAGMLCEFRDPEMAALVSNLLRPLNNISRQQYRFSDAEIRRYEGLLSRCIPRGAP